MNQAFLTPLRGTPLTGRRRWTVGALVAAAATFGIVPHASAEPTTKAEVMVVHATRCAKPSVDPALGDTPPALGYDCMKLVSTQTMPLAVNKASTTALPNGRTFQLLLHGAKGPRYRVTASISPADGSAGFTKLADITATPNKSFNVGGFSHQGGVLVLMVKIVEK